jgi:hypothetical protein
MKRLLKKESEKKHVEPVHMDDRIGNVVEKLMQQNSAEYPAPPILHLQVVPEIDHSEFVKVFGVPCEFTCQNPLHRCFDERGIPIPRVVKMCTDFVNDHGMEEGIFRVNGSAKNIQALKEQWDRAEYTPLTNAVPVNDIACILKQYLRHLPDPLMESSLYNRVRQVFINNETDSVEQKAQKVKKIIDALPNGQYACLERLMALCNRIQKHQNITKMNATNLAICLTPSILAPEKDEVDTSDVLGNMKESSQISFAVSFMISHYSNIFTRNSPYDPELKGLESIGKGWKRKAAKFEAEKSGTLVIEVVSCSDLSGTDNKCDPCVVIELSHQLFSTKTIPKTCNPIFMEQFEVAVYNADVEEIKIAVYSKNDLIGTGSVPVHVSVSKRVAKRVEVNLEPKGFVELTLIPLNYGISTEKKKNKKAVQTRRKASFIQNGGKA